MLGALLALASAATFGLNNAALRRGVLTGGVLQAMAITVPIGVPLFALACLIAGGTDSLSTLSAPGWLWMALAGVIHFVIGRYGNYRATRALGATLSSPIQQLSVPIALVLAVVFLDETVTPLKFFGFVLVMLAPLVMMRRQKGSKPSKTAATFTPRYGEGFLWGFTAAFGYGTSPLFIMKGLGAHRGLVESLVGGLVSYTVAAIIIGILVLFAGGFAFMGRLDRTAGKWFLLSGLFVFLSQMFRYMSLAVAPISVAVPIQRLSPVFRVIFSWLINREHEVFGFWVLFGIGMSMLGAIALTLSTDIAAAWLPASWGPLLHMQWP